jgi:aminoglycoside/choline kinase family phosphotransferase
MSGTERKEAMLSFLDAAGWGHSKAEPLPGDASTRRYIRLIKDGRSAMLMDQPQSVEAPLADANATPEERHNLGYNAVARLAGADCARFIATAEYLRALGLAAPDIYAADTKTGFLLLEDFGDNLYSDALVSGASETELYAAAIDALVAIHNQPAPATLNGVALFDYDETALLAEIDLLTEWFLPLALGRSTNAGEKAEHRDLWQNALAAVRGEPRVFVHRDYHAQNLIWMPDRHGVSRVGMVDFQDAVAGHPAYDLISLLEDARRDVSPSLGHAMMEHYLERSNLHSNAEGFRSAAAILAAQRNAKIIGIFARLFKRDKKPLYLNYLPRVWRYMERDLENPELNNLRSWYERMVPREARFEILRGQEERS